MVAIGLSVLAIIVIPTLSLMFRAAIRWKGVEDRLNHVVKDLGYIAASMKEERRVSERRIRWLEENIWKSGNGNSS